MPHETVIAIKLANGRELLCVTSHYNVVFGIATYKGKIPRKVFDITPVKGDEPVSSHMLDVKHAIEFLIVPGQGRTFMPFFLSTPQFEGVPLGDELTVHSNDVMALNCNIEESTSMQYRQYVGLIKPGQLAPQNFNDRKQ